MFLRILIFFFYLSGLQAGTPGIVVDFMEKDSVNKVQRPWFPTTLPDYKLSASTFSRWAVFGSPELSDATSASCFEIVLLYAIKSGTVDREWVKDQYKFIENSIANKGRDRVRLWIQAWLSILAKDPNKRVNYVRAPRTLIEKIDWGVKRDVSNSIGERIFPNRGDIVFFNPINIKKNSHFDHVAIATGRKITRRMLTENGPDDNVNLETEILSFYGRGSNRDTLIERDTIENMLDEHSMIRRAPPEGPDRQVFFSPPPWI